jgi:thymidine kinase
MFASKSSELLNRMERYYYAKQKVLLVRSKKDIRDYFSHEKANDERLIKMKPDEIAINDFQEIMDKHFEEMLRADYKAIFIDEAFMIKDVWKFCKFESFAKSNPDIFFVGLLASSECEVFPEVVKFLPRCDEIVKLNAVCMDCGSYPANYSYCRGEKNTEILVGDVEYKCLCSTCYFRNKGKS